MLLDFQGKLISPNDINYTILNRAVRYGDGLFETIRVTVGEALFLSDHIARLKKGMAMLGMQADFSLDEKSIRDRIGKLLEETKTGPSARIRLTVFRNTGGLYTPETNTSSSILEAVGLEPAYPLNKKGLELGIFSEHKKPLQPLFSIKSANSLVYVLAGIHKKKNNLDDCLLLNDQGNIAEAISSNVFFLVGESLITPALSEGCVEGVMRKQVMYIAKKLGFTIKETLVPHSVMGEASEVILSNVITGIRWVKRIEDKEYGCEYAKYFMNDLNKLITGTLE